MSLFVPCRSPASATVATPWVSPIIELDAGDVLHFGLMVEALLGAPTAASLALKFRVLPIQANGFNINAETDGVSRPFIDIAAGDGRLGHLLLDGDFPVGFVNETYARTATGTASTTYPATGMVGVERRLRGCAFFKQVQVVATATFTGGTAPAFALAAGFAVQPHFGA